MAYLPFDEFVCLPYFLKENHCSVPVGDKLAASVQFPSAPSGTSSKLVSGFAEEP